MSFINCRQFIVYLLQVLLVKAHKLLFLTFSDHQQKTKRSNLDLFYMCHRTASSPQKKGNIAWDSHFLHPYLSYLSYLSSLPGFFHPAAQYAWHIPHERGHHHGSWGMTPIGRVMFLSKNGQYIYMCVLMVTTRLKNKKNLDFNDYNDCSS